MTNWVRVCAQSELLPGERKIAYDGDVPIAVFNIDGVLYAVEDVCTHDGGELASGELHGFDIDDWLEAEREAYDPQIADTHHTAHPSDRHPQDA